MIRKGEFAEEDGQEDEERGGDGSSVGERREQIRGLVLQRRVEGMITGESEGIKMVLFIYLMISIF